MHQAVDRIYASTIITEQSSCTGYYPVELRLAGSSRLDFDGATTECARRGRATHV